MHFTEPVYRNPYWPTWPLVQITQGCTHNKCKFCTMYKGVPFRMQPMDWLEQDLKELQAEDPHAKTIQLLSANPLALSFDRLMPRLELIRKYLPELEHMYAATRVDDLKNKTVEQLKAIRDIGVNEISLGVESGDDWTLKRINKGYTSQDILEHFTGGEHSAVMKPSTEVYCLRGSCTCGSRSCRTRNSRARFPMLTVH